MIIGVGNGRFYADVWNGIGVPRALGGVRVVRILRARLAAHHTWASFSRVALGKPSECVLYE